MGAPGQAAKLGVSNSQTIFDKTFTSRNLNSSPEVILGMDGDVYDYEVIVFCAGSSGNTTLQLRPNSDSSATNYRQRYIRGNNTTDSAFVDDTSDTPVGHEFIRNNAQPSLMRCRIEGASGEERRFFARHGGNSRTYAASGTWKNTVNNLTSLQITTTSSVTITKIRIIITRTLKNHSQEGWELLKTLTWTAESSEKSFIGLKGDTEEQYRLDWQGSQELNIELNDDATANYLQHSGRNQSGSFVGNTNTDNAVLTDGLSSRVLINPASGEKRVVVVESSNPSADQQSYRTVWWGNTVNEITTIDCTPTASTTGTAKLYRKVRHGSTADTQRFEIIQEVSISGDFSAGHTFSGLSGDDVKLYKIEFLAADGTGTNRTLLVQFNGDTGTNYSYQYVRSDSASETSAAVSGQTALLLLSDSNSSVDSATMYLHPLSGTQRNALFEEGNSEDRISFTIGWWSNTVNEVDAVKVFAGNTNTTTGILRLSKLIK